MISSDAAPVLPSNTPSIAVLAKILILGTNRAVHNRLALIQTLTKLA